MKTLFDYQEDAKALKITKGPKKAISKNQQLFNTLTKRIETLQSNLIIENRKLDNILKIYVEKLKPAEMALAENQIKLAKFIAATTSAYKFGKKQIEKIGEAIGELCNQAFHFIQPDEDTEAFYDQWAEVSYKEEIEQEEAMMKSMFAGMMKNETGMDFDFSDVDLKDPAKSAEKMAEFHRKMEDELRAKYERDNNRKKTKKEIEVEARIKKEEDVKQKSLRNIYISLAKILHPDTETDPQLKAEKEELMKKVTVAYDEKDLTTLLRLEMQWVAKETRHLESLTDEKLKVYIDVLKEQAASLEYERIMMFDHPRYSGIREYAGYPEKDAKYMIDRETKSLLKELKEIEAIVSGKKPVDKKFIIDYVDSFLDEMYLDDGFYANY